MAGAGVKRRSKFRRASVRLIIALFLVGADAPNAFAQIQTKSQQKCTNGLNKDWGKTSNAASKQIQGCIKNFAKGRALNKQNPSVLTLEVCLQDDPKGKIFGTFSKTIQNYQKNCLGRDSDNVLKQPPYGPSIPDTVFFSAFQREMDLIHSIFGPNLNTAPILLESDDKRASLCQQKAFASVSKCALELRKQFLVCKRKDLKNGSVNGTPISDIAGIERCFDGFSQSRFEVKCTGRTDKGIQAEIQKHCVDRVDTLTLSEMFPSCSTDDPASLADCLDSRTRCAFCRSADGADGANRACDDFDNGAVDGSCPDQGCVAGGACSTGELGVCADGIQTCPTGALGPPACQRAEDPTTEICDGLDNDCDGNVDEDFGAGGQCGTGLLGVCADGTLVCDSVSTVTCQANLQPQAELCDGLDNDCDGTVDEDFPLGDACTSSDPGICAPGTIICDGTSAICEPNIEPQPELCDGLDNNCDGTVDDGLGTTTCGLGACDHTIPNCAGGVVQVCDPLEGAAPEEDCRNGIDDDCNGTVDPPDFCTCVPGESCDTGELGLCLFGAFDCPNGRGLPGNCIRFQGPGVEVCDAFDNNCDGQIDEGFNLGATCDTGEPGICDPGLLACPDGDVVCVRTTEPEPEVCDDGIDQDCSGSDCSLLSVGIASPAQGLITADASVEVTGTTGPTVTAVSVNGVAAALLNQTFTATVSLRAGVNMLVAVGSDALGNSGTSTIEVTRDTEIPRVVIDSPGQSARINVNRVTVTGIVNDLITGGIEPIVDVNGVAATVEQGTFMAVDVPLVIGPNPLVATAIDAVGNQGSDQIQVFFDPPLGVKLEPVSGDGQATVASHELAEPLVVRVVDAAGNALASRVVRFQVVRNSGTLRTESGISGRFVEIPTNGAGLASAFFTLGNRAGEGNNRVAASALGASGEAIFCASGQPDTASKLLAVMGESQKGLAGTALPAPFEVLVVDVDGNPVQGVPVTFTAVAGGGNFNGQPTIVVPSAADGLARAILTLGVTEGINNNVVEANFPGNPGSLATFLATALAGGPASETRFAGAVMDNTNSPIPNARVYIENTAIEDFTDDEGQFLLENVPVGHIHLLIDPQNATRPETFPGLAFETVTVAGEINRLPTGPIKIPPLVSEAKLVGGTEDVTLTMPGVPGMSVRVFAGSATFPGGATEGLVSINQVHLDKIPMPPPSGTFFMPPAWTVQPPGVHFDPPAQVVIPNDGLPPGRVIDIFQFDHELNIFTNIGPGTVTEDASVIVSDPGFGITKSGWGGCGQPQPPQTCGDGCDDGNICNGIEECVDGACQSAPEELRAAIAFMLAEVPCDSDDPCIANATCDLDGNCMGDPIAIKITEAPTAVCIEPNDPNASRPIEGDIKPPGRDVNWTVDPTEILNVIPVAPNPPVAKVFGAVRGTAQVTLEDAETQCASDSVSIQAIKFPEEFENFGEYTLCSAIIAVAPGFGFGICGAGGVISAVVFDWANDTFRSECEIANGPEDAARHARWSCELHSNPLTRGVFGDQVLRRHENETKTKCASHEQDLNNNALGKEAGLNGEDCVAFALNALVTGQLQINNLPPAIGTDLCNCLEPGPVPPGVPCP